MSIFISYSNLDGDAVRVLADDLRDAGHTVWLDQDLRGGDAWWRAIVEQIRACSVFVISLSDNALRSKPCQTELGYARALGIPILPVQIGEIATKRTMDIFEIQTVDYREPTPRSGIRLAAAVERCAAQRGPLPDPLPAAPPIPYEYLIRIGTAAAAPFLSSSDQVAAVAELRAALDQEEDTGVRRDIVKLLQALRDRTDVTVRTAGEIDVVLAGVGPAERRLPHGPADDPGPRTGPAPAPAPERPTGPARRAVADNRLSLAAVVAGLVAILCYPLLVGSVAFVLAFVALDRREPLARIATVLAIGGAVLGAALGYLLVGPL